VKSLRQKVYGFLEVDHHMTKLRRERRLMKEKKKALEQDKKLQENRKKLEAKRIEQAKTVREKIGISEGWHLAKTPTKKNQIQDLVVYTSSCPGNTMTRKYTISLLNLLDALKIKYEIKDVSLDRKTREWMLSNSCAVNKRQTPQVFKENRFLAVWPEIHEVHEQGLLLAFLASGKLPQTPVGGVKKRR